MADMIPKLRDMSEATNLVGTQRGIVLVAAQHIGQLQSQLTTVTADRDHLCDLIDAVRTEHEDRLAGTLEGKLKDENKRLKEFARHVIRQECWLISNLDGGDLQELAEKLGLIVPHTATEDDIDEDCDYDVGDKIFKFSDWLKGE